VRRRLFVLAIAAAMAFGMLPAGALGQPVITSDNVELVTTIPDVGAISTSFSSDTPHMYVNTLNGITTYDISNPAAPKEIGRLVLPHFENEGMTLGEREGTKFLLVGYDAYAVRTDSPDKSNAGGYEFSIVDVTDPAKPRIRGSATSKTSVHTISCVADGCPVAYTSGAYEKTFEIFDLTDLDNPKVVKEVKTPVAGGSGSGHQWTYDDAGYLWVAGFAGTAAFDVSDPLNPVAVASTDANGTKPPYNDFIQHNTYRPNATAFSQDVDPETGTALPSGTTETASINDGNVLLITEEDYDNPDCQRKAPRDAGEGGFSTWHVPSMDSAEYQGRNPKWVANKGTITPLDTWNTELVTGGGPTPVGALCSAHYFTYHQAGFIAQAWYQQGVRILDLRDARDIKQVGYFFTGAMEAWNSYFVPARDEAGKVTGEMSNIIYTNDVARGIDVLRVTFPESAPADTTPLQAPILPQWLSGVGIVSSAPSDKFGWACRIPTL
jgi:hypothetical protein